MCVCVGPYTVLLSSTCNGYEGTGRSLSLKLLGELRRGFKGPVNGVGGEKGLRRQLKYRHQLHCLLLAAL